MHESQRIHEVGSASCNGAVSKQHKPYGVVYLLTNTVTGLRYVGQTKRTALQRWKSHCHEAKALKNQRTKRCLMVAINQYGKDAFVVEQIGIGHSAGHLNTLEAFCIGAYKTVSPDGYNVVDGWRFLSIGEEIGRRISASMKGRVPWNKGRPHPESTRAAIGAANRGRKHKNRAPRSPEYCAKMSAAKKGVPNGRKGIPMKPEHRARLSAATKGKKGRHQSEEWRRRMIEINTGNKYGCAPKTDLHRQRIAAAAAKRVRRENGTWLPRADR